MVFYFYDVFSQQDSINIYKIQYERILTFEDDFKPFVSIYEYTKFIEFNKSVYNKKGKIKSPNKLVSDDEDDTILYFTPSGKNVSVVFKDYEKMEFYSKHEVAFKHFVVKDSLGIFNWNINNEKKEILGFKCQLATMDFRGRKYEAWFATELPVGGPWKYDGLPGMILEIKSIDNFISFKAIGVKNTKIELHTLENPFKTNNTLTWSQFKALYKKKAIELISYRPNENAGGVESSRGGIETYIDEDDEEYKRALKKLTN